MASGWSQRLFVFADERQEVYLDSLGFVLIGGEDRCFRYLGRDGQPVVASKQRGVPQGALHFSEWRRCHQLQLAKRSSRFQRPLRGRTAVVALRVGFADVAGSVPSQDHRQLLFGDKGSLKDYYRQVSQGALEILGNVEPSGQGWFQVLRSLRAYGADVGTSDSDPASHDDGFLQPTDLVRDAVAAADPSVDFSRFDSDGDGALDHLILIHAGDDQASSGSASDLWSRQLVLDVPLFTDGVRIESAMLVAESSPLGTLCHEFAHDLGAPDLYGETGIGRWDLMGTGCWNGVPPGSCPARLSAYLAWDLDGDPANGKRGWLAPVFATRGTVVSIVDRPVVLGTLGTASELLLAEVRRRSGYDSALPDEGVLFYRIWRTGPGAELVRPSHSDQAAAALNRAFHSGEVLSLAGEDLVVQVRRVDSDGAEIALQQGPVAVVNTSDPVDDRISLIAYPNPFNAETTLSLIGRWSEPGKILVFDQLGRVVRILSFHSGHGQVNWDGCDVNGLPVPSGTYLLRAVAGGAVGTGKITLLR